MPMLGERPDLEMKTVVFATDFSPCSKNAGAFASHIARFFSARLLVAHAFWLSHAATEAEIDLPLLSQQRKDLNFRLSRIAYSMASPALDAAPVLLEGEPKMAIPKLADMEAPAMIVLGTHGAGRVAHGILGSTAEQILRSTSWPTLTVGPNVPPPSVETFPFRRVLYATDFTPEATHAAPFAVLFAQAFGSGIDVLNVVDPSEIRHPDRIADLQKRFYAALDRVVPGQAREFTDARTFIEAGEAHECILKHIRERNIDLLVLGIRKSSHLSMEMRTSSAFRLIADAACPVLTVRPA